MTLPSTRDRASARWPNVPPQDASPEMIHRHLFKISMDRIEFEPNTGCWLCSYSGPHGYPTVRCRATKELVHRVVWRELRGDIPDGLHLLHKCDTPACCNPDHHFLGTPRDNSRDMISKGRGKGCILLKGEKNPAARLSEQAVRDIFAARSNGQKSRPTIKALAARYRVNPITISQVLQRKTWRHVTISQELSS